MMLSFSFNHLWQSTLFAAVAVLLALALRRNHARTRYWLWMAASVKFLVPFSVLAGVGARFAWLNARPLTHGGLLVIEEFSRPFAQPVVHAANRSAPISMMPLIFAVWMCGFAAVLVCWWLRWRSIQAAARDASPILEGREFDALRRLERTARLRAPIAMLRSTARLEPGVFGILRPALLWPVGVSEHLSPEQLEAILAHELCHVRRRDNLAAAIHMLVEAVFWFHPLVWWLGTKLVEERERACDEEVLRLGSQPQVYAESILKTCEFYLEAPLACMSGVTGSDLKKRIERIMTERAGRPLDFTRRALLATAASAAIAGPILFGVFTAPASQAQSQPSGKRPEFEVASIKPNSSGEHRVGFQIAPGGRFSATNASAKMLIMMAYDLKPYQLSGGPAWLDADKYDVVAKAEGPTDPDQMKLMLQSLLAERFKLAFHKDSKEASIYALVLGKNGPKLQAAAEGEKGKSQFRIGRGQINLQSSTLQQFADALSRGAGRTVLDKTGLKGLYDFKLEWTPDERANGMFQGPGPGPGAGGPEPGPAPDPNGPSLLEAIQEQLGLKLESQKGPVETVIIDHVEKATEN